MVSALLALLVAIAPVSAGDQRQQTPAQRVKAELLKKRYTTKIALGNVLITDELDRGVPATREYARHRLVDTNVFGHGVLFNVRSSLFYAPEGNESVTCERNRPGQWTGDFLPGRFCQVKPGRTVIVDRVDLNDDRMEVWLFTVPENAYAKLKFMFGKDWQRTMDYDAIMEGVSAGLVIHSIERARAIASQYAALQRSLNELGSGPRDKSAGAQLQHASSLRDALKGLISNRGEYEALGKGSTAAEVADYAARLKEIESRIPALEAAARQEKVDALRKEIGDSRTEAAEYRKKLSAQPRTIEELRTSERLLEQWDANLTRRRELEQKLAEMGEVLRDAGTTTIAQEREELAKRRSALAGLAAALEAAALNNAYAKLRTQENQLQSAYVAAFETPRQSEAASRLRAHLQAMIANREAAQRQGLPGAAAEIQRLRSKLQGVR